jgi:hypothetical protein
MQKYRLSNADQHFSIGSKMHETSNSNYQQDNISTDFLKHVTRFINYSHPSQTLTSTNENSQNNMTICRNEWNTATQLCLKQLGLFERYSDVNSPA